MSLKNGIGQFCWGQLTQKLIEAQRSSLSFSSCSSVLHPDWLLQRGSLVTYSIRCKWGSSHFCCAQTTIAPGQCGVILDTSRPEPVSQRRPKAPTSTSTGSVPCIPKALTSKTWYKTLEMSLHKDIRAERGLVGPALHHAQINILGFVLG